MVVSDEVDDTAVGVRPDRLQARNVATVAVIGLMVVLAWQHRWTFDDGFINFRIVKQLEAGHGPVFNSGQRVEAYTSPAWLFLLAFFDIATPLRIEWVSVVLGIGLTATGLGAGISASRRLWSGIDEHATEVPIGAITVVAMLPFWYFATSGLEGGLTFAWLGVSLWILSKWASRSRPLSRWEWLVVGAGWLVRPELVLFSLAAAIAVVAAEGSERSILRRIGATGWAWILPAGYELFRMGYFATLLPNTAYAKAATGTRWDKGWQYLSHFVGTYWLWLPVAALVVAGYFPLIAKLRRARDRRFAVVVAWLIAIALTTVYIVRIGGDYVDARLLLPGFFAFCGPVAVSRLSTPARALASVALAGWVAVAATSLRPPLAYRAYITDPRMNVVTLSDALRGRPEHAAHASMESADLTFEFHPLAGRHNPALAPRTAAVSGIGILSYAMGTNVDIFDLGGLADPIIARFELPVRGLPGHEKIEPPAWSAARLLAAGTPASPTPFIPFTYLYIPPLIPTTSGATFERQVTEARHTLQCGAVRNLQHAVNGRLGIGGFFANMTHSLEFSLLTIPPDPARAERKFCPGR